MAVMPRTLATATTMTGPSQTLELDVETGPDRSTCWCRYLATLKGTLMTTFSATSNRISLTLAVLVSTFLAFDFITHLALESHVVEYNAKIGAPVWFPQVCGAVLGTLVIGYWIPATRAMATVLITAYLGGAVATNLITEQPLFNTFFAVFVAAWVWAGAWTRDARLRALVRPAG